MSILQRRGSETFEMYYDQMMPGIRQYRINGENVSEDEFKRRHEAGNVSNPADQPTKSPTSKG